jgi:hypothetical protein
MTETIILVAIVAFACAAACPVAVLAVAGLLARRHEAMAADYSDLEIQFSEIEVEIAEPAAENTRWRFIHGLSHELQMDSDIWRGVIEQVGAEAVAENVKSCVLQCGVAAVADAMVEAGIPCQYAEQSDGGAGLMFSLSGSDVDVGSDCSSPGRQRTVADLLDEWGGQWKDWKGN